MDGFFSLIKFFFGCGTLLVIVMIVLAHMPKSPLRTLLVQICGWGGAVLCGVYAAAPVDCLPEIVLGPAGLIDDLVAVILGFMSARAAWTAGEEETPADEQKRKAA